MGGIAWKAILSEAVVTRDTVPGLQAAGATFCKTVPCYTSDNDEVLPYRQPYGHDLSEGFAPGYDRITSLRSVGPRTNLA